MLLQKIVFPSNEICRENELYVRGVLYDIENKSLILNAKQICDFDTYFNSFSIKKWEKYTNISGLKLKLDVQGICKIYLCYVWIDQKNIIRRSGDNKFFYQNNSKERTQIELQYPGHKEGVIAYFRVEALDETVRIYSAEYHTDISPDNLNRVKIAVGICTYKREEFLFKNINIINNNILHNKNSLLYNNLDIFISDNGQSIEPEKIKNKSVFLFHNKNLGGSGGFTRCLIEVLEKKRDYGYTHIILMDDDIVLDTQTLEKTYVFLSLLKSQYKDSMIGGSMLIMQEMYKQFENAARYYKGFLSFKNKNIDLRAIRNIIQNELPVDVNYNAWCYCCMPLDKLSLNNLPIPFFIHMDDVEYGVRNKFNIITLNGICVWHPFYTNQRGASIVYYDIRNKLITMSEFGGEDIREYARHYLNLFQLDIVNYNYERFLAACKGLKDFCIGIDYFKGVDAVSLHKELAVFNKEWIDAPADMKSRVNKAKNNPMTKWQRRLNYILPANKGELVIDYDISEAFPYRYKTLVLYNKNTNKCCCYNKNIIKVLQCKLELIKAKFLINHKLLGKSWEWKERLNELTNLPYWREYLGIKSEEKKMTKEKNSKVLSVVIPAYNMEKYIRKALDSLVCDEYMQDLEVLIIDDGSKDHTADIAEEYVEKYPSTFKLIRKENGGHGSVLNKGIELATGKYFRPLDADDWVDTNALKAVIDEMKKNNADMVLTNFRKILEVSNKTINIRIKNVWNKREIEEGRAIPKAGRNVLLYGKVYDFNKDLFDYSPQYLFHHISYRTDLLRNNNIKFDEHVFYDDMEYDIFPLPYVKTVLPIDRYLYQYRLEREGQSVDEASFAKNHAHRRLIVEHICKYFVQNKDKFGSNVYEYLKEDIIWKVIRQYEIYLKLMKACKKTKCELIGFSQEIEKIDPKLYQATADIKIRLIRKSKGFLYPVVANKKIQKWIEAWRTRNLPNSKAKSWTIASDKPMHRKILYRKILKFFHLSWMSKDMRRIRRFKNIHKGERCFITCTGPSLTIRDLEKLEGEYTIGVNSITKAYSLTKWRPTYYALVDIFAFGNYLKENAVEGNSFCKREGFFHYRANPKTKNGRETYLLVDYHNHKEEWMKKGKIKYSPDISVCVYDGFTVTNMAIQIAIYMGFKKIYILGADCDYSSPKIHFVEMPDDQKKIKEGWLPNATDLSIKGYIAMRDFAYKNKCEIYNVTRGGKLEVFYRDDLDRVLSKKQ